MPKAGAPKAIQAGNKEHVEKQRKMLTNVMKTKGLRRIVEVLNQLVEDVRVWEPQTSSASVTN